MFWQWNSEWSWMENERGESDSQTHALSQRLFAHTAWGDYSGSIHSRIAYEYLLAEAEDAVEVLTAGHVQGLILKAGKSLRTVLEVLLELEENGYLEDCYEIESRLEVEELHNWMIPEFERQVSTALEDISDWDGRYDILDEIDHDEWLDLFMRFMMDSFEGNASFEWEGATSLITRDENPDAAQDAAEYLLSEFAKQFNPTQDEKLEESE